MKAFTVVVVAVFAMVGGAWWHGPIQAQTGAAGGVESKTVSFADSTEAPAEAAPATGLRRRVLNDREARRLGVSFGSVRSAVKELRASGVIDGSESNSELAAIVADHIASKKENAAAFKAGSVDWEALMSLISRILELIFKFFP